MVLQTDNKMPVQFAISRHIQKLYLPKRCILFSMDKFKAYECLWLLGIQLKPCDVYKATAELMGLGVN